MEQNNFNGQEQIPQNNTVHQPHQPSHEPEAQQIHANNGNKSSQMAQQSASSYNIHHSNPQYTSPIHNGTSYEHNPSSYENGNTNGKAPLHNGNNISHNKKSKSYGYFMLTALLVAIVITAVVIGAGWAVFYPRPTTSRQTLESTPSSTITQDDTDVTDTEASSESKDLVIIYGGNNNISDTTTKKTTSQTKLNDAPRTASPSSPPPPSPPVQKTASAPKATVAKTIAAKKLSPPPTPPTIPVPSTPSEHTTKYWIQVFSTNNRDKAMQIKKTLDEQGIKATVITKTINNKMYYRLRIGPYYNKNEGHKFLEWVKRNEQYKDAYISVNRS